MSVKVRSAAVAPAVASPCDSLSLDGSDCQSRSLVPKTRLTSFVLGQKEPTGSGRDKASLGFAAIGDANVRSGLSAAIIRRWLQRAIRVRVPRGVRAGIARPVSKRIDAPYRSGPCKTWLKSKNPASEAVRREQEEDWR